MNYNGFRSWHHLEQLFEKIYWKCKSIWRVIITVNWDLFVFFRFWIASRRKPWADWLSLPSLWGGPVVHGGPAQSAFPLGPSQPLGQIQGLVVMLAPQQEEARWREYGSNILFCFKGPRGVYLSFSCRCFIFLIMFSSFLQVHTIAWFNFWVLDLFALSSPSLYGYTYILKKPLFISFFGGIHTVFFH